MIESLVVKKIAPKLFRYFFAINAPENTPLRGLLSVRVFARGFRLLGTTEHFKLDLQPGQVTSFSVESPFLFKNPRYIYQVNRIKGRGEVTALREDLSTILSPNQ